MANGRCGREVTVTPLQNWQNEPRWQVIKRIVLVKDSLFSHIVNSNLEVRTSVAISPETGAAEEGALFTYEALPALRSSPPRWCWMIMVWDRQKTRSTRVMVTNRKWQALKTSISFS
ncbi:RAMP superfamily CRISPR-associated protein [Leptothermofonsia sp. ETS-13]|uniref:RAMP superfamily CRISPR-associated protein n=1 Tax=Leptothermofonsia sp. ETS-13 TaxID=3035696 RepID=UPI003BA21A34